MQGEEERLPLAIAHPSLVVAWIRRFQQIACRNIGSDSRGRSVYAISWQINVLLRRALETRQRVPLCVRPVHFDLQRPERTQRRKKDERRRVPPLIEPKTHVCVARKEP